MHLPPAAPRAVLPVEHPGKQLALLFGARGPHLFVHEGLRQSLERRLAALMDQPVALSITDNRRTMISSTRRNGTLELRLHHMFLDARAEIVRALALYIRRNHRESSDLLSDFIQENNHRIRWGRRRTRMRTDGRHHDLREIFDELNDFWFGGSVDVLVTWGRRAPGKRRSRTSIRLGTYCAQDRLIRIHPALDKPWVPRFFVAYIMFHEMLHHIVPAPVKNGRQCFHSPEFRERERAYPDYERALRWEQRNIHRLLTT